MWLVLVNGISADVIRQRFSMCVAELAILCFCWPHENMILGPLVTERWETHGINLSWTHDLQPSLAGPAKTGRAMAAKARTWVKISEWLLFEATKFGLGCHAALLWERWSPYLSLYCGRDLMFFSGSSVSLKVAWKSWPLSDFRVSSNTRNLGSKFQNKVCWWREGRVL